ncbi:MAG: hypothetical protein SFV15_12845 [Polyangiaceae bacterium]|nr:hypothetical protein [Polyangiaceae bacterium]
MARNTPQSEPSSSGSPESLIPQLPDLRIWVDEGRPVALAARTRPLLGGGLSAWSTRRLDSEGVGMPERSSTHF